MTTCVSIPFYNRLDLIQNCLSKLGSQVNADILLLLIDDGSSDKVHQEIKNHPLLKKNNVFLIRHEKNKGAPAGRNTSVKWCREHGVDMIIMVDCDCDVPPDFIQKHIDLHKQYPEVACFGGGICGVGSGYWATVDKIMSWAPSIPIGNVRELNKAYYPPAANISFKVDRLPKREKVFNENLVTGEDVLLVRELRKNKEKIYFSPEPSVKHHDRDKMKDVIRHVYEWGKHIYFIQMGNNYSERCFKLWYRIPFILAFLPALLAFAGLGLVFTLMPWLGYKQSYIVYFPWVFLLWIVKGFAILKMAFNPYQYLAGAKHYGDS